VHRVEWLRAARREGRVVQVRDDGPLHGLAARDQGLERTPRPLVLEQRRDVHAGQPGQLQQQPAPGLARVPGLGQAQENLGQQGLAVAQDHQVEEGRGGLGVAGAAAPGHDQRRSLAQGRLRRPVRGAEGNPRQVEHVQHVGEAQFVRHVEAHGVELGQVRVRLQRAQGGAAVPEDVARLAVRREDPLGPQPRDAVDRVQQDHHPGVGHADLVQVGESQGQPRPDRGRVLADAAGLVARVAAGPRQQGQQFAHGNPLGRAAPASEGVLGRDGRLTERRRPPERYLRSSLDMLETLPAPPTPWAARSRLRSALAGESVRLLVASR